MSNAEYDNAVQSVTAMLANLDMALHTSRDTADILAPTLAARVSNGRRGRPRVVISEGLLREGSRIGGTNRQLAQYADCHPRTIRRRKLEAGLGRPGRSVREVDELEDGSHTARYRNPAVSTIAEISDNDLDAAVTGVLQDMPGFGRRMIEGALRALGFRVQQKRVRESLLRVKGVPGVFGDRRVHRREYRVAGPNSLWHHDGQHGESGRLRVANMHLLITRSQG
jgi:hypothetical protein